MVKQIVWTAKAKNELFDILQYWNNRNKSNTFSLKLNALFDEQINLIAEFPKIGRKTDIQNVNIKVIQQYLMYYEIVNESLYILTIRHGSRSPKTLKLR